MERQPNPDQLRVIDNLHDNLIVFASAGTGKTFTVAQRISRILQTELAQPGEILCLTFTTKACEEMREDIACYAGGKAKEVEIRTIHGFCYQFIRQESRYRGDRYLDATVCDEVDTEELLKSILSSQLAIWEGASLEKGEEFSERSFEIFTKKGKLYNFISALKHIRQERKFYSKNDEEDYQKTFDFIRSTRADLYDKILSFSTKRGGHVRDYEFEKVMTHFAGRLAFTYDTYLQKSNRLDFDDLIIFTRRYLEEAETLARWARRYRYIIVDEMQDTSLLEYSVLKRIFGENKVMLCGDFFQSIYGWRGSNPTQVLDDFMHNFHAKVYTLSENYRSTRALTGGTFGYLTHTYPSLMGKYTPENLKINSVEEGEKILLLGFDNRREEAHRIYRYLKKSVEEKRGSLCVIARSNFYLSSLLRNFEEYNLEYPPAERLRFLTNEEHLQFFKKPVVKDVLAVLKLLFNGADRVSMERVTERFVRLVGIKTIEGIRLQNRIGISIVSFLDKQVYEYLDPYHVLIESFQKGDIVVYDTETTGLDLQSDQMVQLSAVRLDCEGNIVATFDEMIEPTVPIAQAAYETHGFDLDYIRAHGGRSAKEVLTEFSNFVRGATLVGHNAARFDSPMIKRQLKECGLPPLEIAAEYDTLTIAKEFHPELPDFRLSTLCFKYEIVNEAAHNAYGDIVATAKVLVRLLTEDIQRTAIERQAVCAKHKDKFEKLYHFFEELRAKVCESSASETIAFLIDKMMIRKKCANDSDQRALGALIASFHGVEKEDAERVLSEYTAKAELSVNHGKALFAEQNIIPLLTVHQAKGCEFDTVIVAGADDRNFPNFFSKNEQTEEEEKRVFYVAISRAKKKLILTRASYHGTEELFPSPYVKNIPDKFVWKNERWETND